MLRRAIPLTLLLAAAIAPGAQARTYDFGTIASPDPSAQSSHAILHAAGAIKSGRADAKTGYELTPLLKEIATRLPRLHGGERSRAEHLLARPTIGDATDSDSPYTVVEHRPAFCSAHYCIHWVDSTADAPPLADANHNGVPDYVETMDGVFEHVYDVENIQLGWRAPKPDGNLGGNDLTDVYIKDLAGQGIYGYSAPDPGQRTYQQHAYLVMENDYNAQQFPKYGGNPLPPMEVTGAHEYNHVLQFGYDYAQDTWMFEATAVWMEDKVYTDINDYVQYMTPWSQLSSVPLTQFNGLDQSDPLNIKVYGDAAFTRWIDSHFGADTVRNAWERSLSTKPKSFAPGAFDSALRAHGSSFYDSFSNLAAATAEWRDSDSGVTEGSTYPDMRRVLDRKTGQPITLDPNDGSVRGRLAHTTFGIVNVGLTQAPRIKLVVSGSRKAQLAAALVCRVGDEVTGTSSIAMARLPSGGASTVTLDDPGRCARISAVLINADGRTTGRFSNTLRDWEWRSEDIPLSAHISTDFTPPAVKMRKPAPNARVRPSSKLRVVFSEPLAGLDSRHVFLIGPHGHKVKVKIRHHGASIQIVPLGHLHAGVRYTIRFGSGVEDAGGNPLPEAVRSWNFRTRH